MRKNKFIKLPTAKEIENAKHTIYKVTKDGKGRAAIKNLTTGQTRIMRAK